ncbi:MAG: hypothetical protein M1543_02060 [Firmicutes bacterium]|nr:hypothetical protein [Bacillota bacterium]
MDKDWVNMKKTETIKKIEELSMRVEIILLIKRIKRLRRMLLDLVINPDNAKAQELLTITEMLDQVMDDYNRLVLEKP